nr:uncharacterized protein LOC113827609 [Penaeus vannamei]
MAPNTEGSEGDAGQVEVKGSAEPPKGYDLSSESGFQTFVDDFGKIIGWQFLRGLHINDSKGKVGDHKDRHENIGKGTIGIEGFRRIMNCSYFNDVPLILETPWTSNEGYAKEIKILEGLVKA